MAAVGKPALGTSRREQLACLSCIPASRGHSGWNSPWREFPTLNSRTAAAPQVHFGFGGVAFAQLKRGKKEREGGDVLLHPTDVFPSGCFGNECPLSPSQPPL